MKTYISVVLNFIAAISFVLQHSSADIYLHNPRGSNNRLNGRKQNVQNNQRLFDSQNNNAGGLNVGDVMNYLVGSKLRIQWTNQHSCGDENANCEVIIQYMCGENVKDGTTTTTVPDSNRRCKRRDCDRDTRFGTHESFAYYRECVSRQRNMNLYTDGLSPRKSSAKYTRQNRNGKRYGYECQEEKDYYPYWAPTPWKSKRDKVILYNNETECINSNIEVRRKKYTGKWLEAPSHAIKAPDCLKSQFTRDNHHGNTIGGDMPFYDWTIPDLPSSKCVLRLRYNISTNDYDSWSERSEPRENLAPTHIWERFGLEKTDAALRGYYLTNDPSVDVFNLHETSLPKFKLKLAIDTQQYGRTFEDRSHVFTIAKRPNGVTGEIHNVNVRGKRGNIVQVYPSTEYDFVPNALYASVGDFVHFQWTGSNSNPQRFDGQGRKSTDRHNVVQLKKRYTFTKPSSVSFAVNYPTGNSTLMGFNVDDFSALSQSSTGPLLERSSTYFDIGPLCLTKPGQFYYMSTRNNHFSNRDQKAAIYVGGKCFKNSDRGASYNGHASVSASGKQCMNWNENEKLRVDRTFSSNLAENYCRNPRTRSHRSPWCYVNNGRRKIMERCNVPMCRRGK